MGKLQKKNRRRGAVPLVLALACLTLPTSAQSGLSAGFTASVLIPDNQRDGSQGYFDLLVQPGEVQELPIRIVNKENREITLSVSVGTASTNRNGVLVYTGEGALHSSLEFSLEDHVDIPQQQVVVPANSQVDIAPVLTVPDEAFSGILLGAVTVLKELTEEELQSDATFLNQFSYVIPVKLDTRRETISSALELDRAALELVNGRPAIVAHVANPQPKLMRNLSAQGAIYAKDGGEPLLKKELDDFSMAPNSLLAYSFDIESALPPGQYTAKFHITSPEDQWDLVHDFTVADEDVTLLEENGTVTAEPKTPLPSGSAQSEAQGVGKGARGVVLMATALLAMAAYVASAQADRRRKTDPPNRN